MSYFCRCRTSVCQREPLRNLAFSCIGNLQNHVVLLPAGKLVNTCGCKRHNLYLPWVSSIRSLLLVFPLCVDVLGFGSGCGMAGVWRWSSRSFFDGSVQPCQQVCGPCSKEGFGGCIFLGLFDKECGMTIWFEHDCFVTFLHDFLYWRWFSLSLRVETICCAGK